MSQVPEISAVLPAYNEKESITDCLLELHGVLSRLGRPFEIVVVDDGSRDGTFELLRGLKGRMPELRAASFKQNRGQTAAMAAGFQLARGEIVVTLDSDMQNDPADIPRMLELMDRYDVVCGVRAKRNDNAIRRLSSRIGNGVRNWLTNDTITDTGCTLKLFRRKFLLQVKLYEGMHRFLPTLLKLVGARVTEIPVNHRPRTRGTAKYGIGNRALKGLRDCLAVRWMQRRWIRYEIGQEMD